MIQKKSILCEWSMSPACCHSHGKDKTWGCLEIASVECCLKDVETRTVKSQGVVKSKQQDSLRTGAGAELSALKPTDAKQVVLFLVFLLLMVFVFQLEASHPVAQASLNSPSSCLCFPSAYIKGVGSHSRLNIRPPGC